MRESMFMHMAAQGLQTAYSALNDAARLYVDYLQDRYGYSLHGALETVYTKGWEPRPFDYAAGFSVRETRTPEWFGF